MTSEARLKLEQSEAQNEIQRLKDRLTRAPPSFHTDFSLISLISRWSDTESAVSLEECFSSIEVSVRIGNWLEADCLQVAVLELVDNVRTFFNSCPELHAENVLCQNFQTTFRDRPKTARRCYDFQGIRNFAKECPARQRWRGKPKNSPGKENPSERSKSQGVRLNPGY